MSSIYNTYKYAYMLYTKYYKYIALIATTNVDIYTYMGIYVSVGLKLIVYW